VAVIFPTVQSAQFRPHVGSRIPAYGGIPSRPPSGRQWRRSRWACPWFLPLRKCFAAAHLILPMGFVTFNSSAVFVFHRRNSRLTHAVVIGQETGGFLSQPAIFMECISPARLQLQRARDRSFSRVKSGRIPEAPCVYGSLRFLRAKILISGDRTAKSLRLFAFRLGFGGGASGLNCS